MDYITLDSEGFAVESGWISCYAASYTGEYIGQRDEYLTKGTGLPAGAYLDAPPAIGADEVIVRTENGWEVFEDHRGAVIYSTADQTYKTLNVWGDVPAGYTLLAPTSEFDVWNGTAWILDEAAAAAGAIAAAKQQRDYLLRQAAEVINYNLWTSKFVLNRLSAADNVKFLEWMDYTDALNAIDTTHPVWPTTPIIP